MTTIVVTKVIGYLSKLRHINQHCWNVPESSRPASHSMCIGSYVTTSVAYILSLVCPFSLQNSENVAFCKFCYEVIGWVSGLKGRSLTRSPGDEQLQGHLSSRRRGTTLSASGSCLNRLCLIMMNIFILRFTMIQIYVTAPAKVCLTGFPQPRGRACC